MTNDFQCCPNASVGNHPAGIKSWDGTGRLLTDADETDQFCPPQSSFEPRHNDAPEQIRLTPGGQDPDEHAGPISEVQADKAQSDQIRSTEPSSRGEDHRSDQ